MLIVVLEREPLPGGPHRARMIVRDHLGNRYRKVGRNWLTTGAPRRVHMQYPAPLAA